MNKLNILLQKYCMVTFVAIVLLKACTVGLKTVTATNKYSEMMETANEVFGEDPPEELLAYLDDKHLENEKYYSDLLDELESECFEGRNEIALLSLTSYQKYRQAEFNYSVSEVLEYYLVLAQSTNNIDSCKEIYISVAEDYE